MKEKAIETNGPCTCLALSDNGQYPKAFCRKKSRQLKTTQEGLPIRRSNCPFKAHTTPDCQFLPEAKALLVHDKVELINLHGRIISVQESRLKGEEPSISFLKSPRGSVFNHSPRILRDRRSI